MSEYPAEALANPTLGVAATSPFLDQVEKQNKEDFNARHEGREPRTVVTVDRVPGAFIPSGSVPSDWAEQQLAFKDELPVAEESNEEESEEFNYNFEDSDDDS